MYNTVKKSRLSLTRFFLLYQYVYIEFLRCHGRMLFSPCIITFYFFKAKEMQLFFKKKSKSNIFLCSNNSWGPASLQSVLYIFIFIYFTILFLRIFVCFVLFYCKMYVILTCIENDDKQMWFCHQSLRSIVGRVVMFMFEVILFFIISLMLSLTLNVALAAVLYKNWVDKQLHK